MRELKADLLSWNYISSEKLKLSTEEWQLTEQTDLCHRRKLHEWSKYSRELCPHFSLSSSLSTSTFLPLSFNWGLVVSSLKACPHIPTSSLRALDHLLPTCRPTGTDRKQIEIHPAALKHTLLLDVQSDCICRISLTSGRIKTIHFHAQSNLFCIFPNSLEIMTYYHITDPLLSTHSSPNTAPSHSLRGMAENREYKLSYQGERVRRETRWGKGKTSCLSSGKSDL